MRKLSVLVALLVVGAISSVGVASTATVGSPIYPAVSTSTIIGSQGDTAVVTTTLEAPQIISPSDNISCSYCPNQYCYYQQWSQSSGGSILGVGWKETHKGARYWNCRVIWQAQRGSWDTQGYHHCGYHSGTGFSISVDACWKRNDPSFYLMDDAERFTVSLIAKSFPFSETYEMCPYFDPYGGNVYKPNCV
jgi:hypothetical protein